MATLKALRETQRKLDEFAAVVRDLVKPVASDWIKCSDRLPEEGQHIICSGFIYDDPSAARYVAPSTYHDDVFRGYVDEDDDERDALDAGEMHAPTHWQPMPAPPTD